MSDIARDLDRQPTAIPVLGSSGGVYVDPGEAWDTTPVRSALSNSEELAGYVPGTKLPAEVLNDQLGRIAEALSTIMDTAAITWSPPAKTVGDVPAFEGTGNGLFAGPLTAPAQVLPLYQGEVLCAVNANGLAISRDGRRWTERGAIGFSTQVEAMAAGLMGGGDCLIVAFAFEAGNYEFRYTSDLGSSWADAGVAPTAPNSTIVVGYFDEKFLWASDDGVMAFSDDITGGVWTDISGEWASGAPVMFATRDGEVLLGLDASPYVIRSSDGENWTDFDTGLTGSGAVVHIAWSQSHQLWFMIRSDDTVWVAPSGLASWTQIDVEGPSGTLTALHSIAAHGRAIVLAADDGLYVSRDLARWARLLPIGDTVAGEPYWRHLVPFNGALWAARVGTKSTGSGSTFEHTMSGVIAPELMRIAAW